MPAGRGAWTTQQYTYFKIMKMIQAIVRPFKLEEVEEALKEAGVTGMTVTTDAKGYGKQNAHIPRYCGDLCDEDSLPRTIIEVLAADENVDAFVAVIMRSARIGKVGDGKIFVTSIEQVVRIRTGERNEAAV